MWFTPRWPPPPSSTCIVTCAGLLPCPLMPLEAQWTGLFASPDYHISISGVSGSKSKTESFADPPTGVHNHISTAGAALDPPSLTCPPSPSAPRPLAIYIRFLTDTVAPQSVGLFRPWTASSSLDESGACTPPLPISLLPAFLGVVIIRA